MKQIKVKELSGLVNVIAETKSMLTVQNCEMAKQNHVVVFKKKINQYE
jgi:hypothetical protein